MAEAEEKEAAQRESFERLRVEHGELKADMAALLRCLRRQGTITDADWRRERFDEEGCEEGCRISVGTTLQASLEPPAATIRIAAYAGQKHSSILRCASQSLRTSLDAVREEGLLVVGGYAFSHSKNGEARMKDCEFFLQEVGWWQPLPAMGWSRAGHVGVAHRGCLFVCGGDNDEIRRSVICFNPRDKSLRWRIFRSMNKGRTYAAAVSIGQHLYISGGNDAERCPFQSVERFRPGEVRDKTREWEWLPGMTMRREGHAAVALRGHFFVCGGCSSKEKRSTESSAEMLSPLTGFWKALPNMITGRTAHAAAVLRGKVYVTGGDEAKFGSPMGSVEMYDWATGAWSSCTAMPQVRSCHASAVLGGRLYVFGGHLKSRLPPAHETLRGEQEPAESSVECYDPETGAWEAAPSMTKARAHFCAVAVCPDPVCPDQRACEGAAGAEHNSQQ